MKPMGKIPVGWMAYAPIGNQVPGTRFIAFKVPLRETFVDKLKPEDRFTVPILLERVPELGLIIDLTQTVRYYNKNEVLDRGVDYVKIPTPGQVVPSQQYVDRFFEVVDYYLDTHKGDDSLIGVHCTHGVNRTGYMLCRYLIQRLGYSFEDAIEAVGTARGHPIERSPYLTSLREHREATLKKSTRGDLEEGKSKMSKKSVIKPPKKSSEPRAIMTGKERFPPRREEGYPLREDHRSRSPHRVGPYGDFGGDRAMVGREPSHLMRGRTPPPHPRGRTPPPHLRGRTPPPHLRGRTPPPHPRGRSPPYMNTPPMAPSHSSYPPHGRSPPRRSPPPHHMRGRSPPPPQHIMRGRSPPPSRGRTPPHMRGRSPPPPHYYSHQEPRPPVRGRSPPPHLGHMRERTPPSYLARGRTPPPMRSHTPPPAPREVPHSPGNFARREAGPMSRRSPPRGREIPPGHDIPRSDRFPPGRRTPPPVGRQEPPPMRGHSPVTARREPPSQSRIPPEEYYRGEYRAGASGEPSKDYSSSSKYQSRQHPYTGETSHYTNYYEGYYHGNQHRERSRSPLRGEEAAFYSDRRKEVSPQRDIKRRRKSPTLVRDKSIRSPPRYGNGRDVGGPPDRRESHPEEDWNRLQQDYGPDCREILNERRSMRDPYQDAEYEDRKRSLAERLPPKNVDLRESLEEEKRRKQGYAEPYPAGDYEKKRARRDFPDYEGGHGGIRGGYEPPQAPHYDYHAETQVGGADYGGRPFGGRGGGGGRGGKRVFDRLARGRRGGFRN